MAKNITIPFHKVGNDRPNLAAALAAAGFGHYVKAGDLPVKGGRK